MKTRIISAAATLCLWGSLSLTSGCTEVDQFVGDNGNEAEELQMTRADGETPYYFYNHENKKVYLTLDTKYAFLSAEESALPANISEYGVKTTGLRADLASKKQNRIAKDRFYTELSFSKAISDGQYLKLLSDIGSRNRDVIVAPYFNDQNGKKIGLSNLFYVKLKNEEDIAVLEETAAQMDCVIVGQNEVAPLWFTLSVTGTSKLNALECANFFHESGLFSSAEPDLMGEFAYSNDQYFNQQYYLKNWGQTGGTPGVDINVEQAWNFSTGENIVVAVIDGGVDQYHYDLEPNMHPLSFDAQTGTLENPQWQELRYAHGTAVAGIIGAVKDNGIGIAGVAPDCQIMAISDDCSMIRPGLIQEFAIAIDWAWINGADVINCSWGDQSIFDGPYITDAVNRAVTQGRGGKGCVVVVSAGNEGVNAVSFPARLPNVIAVGAVDKNGLVCDYSNEGSELDVVAPSGKTGMKGDVYTTDIAGDDGYESPGDYTSSFGGTSAAAPQVSGIAALILSLNPDLEYDEVAGIITSTADRPIRNNQYGYGLVDAHKAVSQTLDMLYGHLVISGPDQPALNTTVTYTVPAPPSGLEFDSWTISPGNGYTVMGSTSTTLSIRFSTMNLYTITANYTLSNGSNYSVTKEKINLYPLPTITGPNSVRLNRAAAYKLSGSLPSGVTVQRWDLTPGTMLLWESALSDLRFDPLFYTVGLNTVSVTFDLPGGQTYTVTKGVNVTNGGVIPETPILEPFSDYSDQYGAEIENGMFIYRPGDGEPGLRVTNIPLNVVEYQCDNGMETYFDTYPYVIMAIPELDPNTPGLTPFFGACRVNVNGIWSDWGWGEIWVNPISRPWRR